MDRLGIEQHLTLDGSASSFAAIFLDRQGNRAIYMMRGATAELTPAEIRQTAWRVHPPRTHRHDGNLAITAGDASSRFCASRASIEIPTVLDVDVPPSDACPALGTKADLERALKLATYLKPAKAAARELADAMSRRGIAEAIARKVWQSSGAHHRWRQRLRDRGRGRRAGKSRHSR